MYARQLARRAGREVYFNFWFAAEGVGANNLSTWTKLVHSLRSSLWGTCEFETEVLLTSRSTADRDLTEKKVVFEK